MDQRITRLWLADNLPSGTGSTDRMAPRGWCGSMSARPGGLAALERFDLEAFSSANPERLTSIDVTVLGALPDGSGYLCAAEGSYGSEGFFGWLDQQENLASSWIDLASLDA